MGFDTAIKALGHKAGISELRAVPAAQELCRKLQKENKRVMEASQKLASAEAAMRCESRTQVDATLAGISTKCASHHKPPGAQTWVC